MNSIYLNQILVSTRLNVLLEFMLAKKITSIKEISIVQTIYPTTSSNNVLYYKISSTTVQYLKVLTIIYWLLILTLKRTIFLNFRNYHLLIIRGFNPQMHNIFSSHKFRINDI